MDKVFYLFKKAIKSERGDKFQQVVHHNGWDIVGRSSIIMVKRSIGNKHGHPLRQPGPARDTALVERMLADIASHRRDYGRVTLEHGWLDHLDGTWPRTKAGTGNKRDDHCLVITNHEQELFVMGPGMLDDLLAITRLIRPITPLFSERLSPKSLGRVMVWQVDDDHYLLTAPYARYPSSSSLGLGYLSYRAPSKAFSEIYRTAQREGHERRISIVKKAVERGACKEYAYKFLTSPLSGSDFLDEHRISSRWALANMADEHAVSRWFSKKKQKHGPEIAANTVLTAYAHYGVERFAKQVAIMGVKLITDNFPPQEIERLIKPELDKRSAKLGAYDNIVPLLKGYLEQYLKQNEN